MTKCCGRIARIVADTALVKIEYCFVCKKRHVTDRRKAGQKPFYSGRRLPSRGA